MSNRALSTEHWGRPTRRMRDANWDIICQGASKQTANGKQQMANATAAAAKATKRITAIRQLCSDERLETRSRVMSTTSLTWHDAKWKLNDDKFATRCDWFACGSGRNRSLVFGICIISSGNCEAHSVEQNLIRCETFHLSSQRRSDVNNTINSDSNSNSNSGHHCGFSCGCLAQPSMAADNDWWATTGRGCAVVFSECQST